MLEKHLDKVLSAFIAIALLFLGVLAYNNFFSDSEIWAVNVSLVPYSEALSNPSLVYKFVFHAFIKLLATSGLENVELLHLVRLSFFVVSCISLLTLYLISLEVFNQKSQALAVVLVTLSTSYFLSRGFRIRSDNLALLFYLLALFEIVKMYRRELFLSRWAWTRLIVWSILCLLSTPKAIFFIICIYASLVFLISEKVNFKNFLQRNRKFVFAILGFVIVSVLLFRQVVFSTYERAFLYFVQTFDGGQAGNFAYLSIRKFVYIIRFFEENPVFSLSLFAALLAPLYKAFKPYRHIEKLKNMWLLLSVILLLSLLINPDKLPFFIASLVPSFSILIVIFVTDLSRYLQAVEKAFSRNTKFIVLLVAVALMLKISFFFQRNLTYNNNYLQIQVMRQFEFYLKQYPEATHYDAVGVLPSKKKDLLYIGYAEKDVNERASWKLMEKDIDIVLFANRMFTYANDFLFWLQAEYLNYGNGFWVKAKTFKVYSFSEFEPDYKYKNTMYYKYDAQDFKDEVIEKFKKHIDSKTKIFIYFSYHADFVADKILLQDKSGKVGKFRQGLLLIDLDKYDSILFPENDYDYKATVFSDPKFQLDRNLIYVFGFDRSF